MNMLTKKEEVGVVKHLPPICSPIATRESRRSGGGQDAHACISFRHLAHLRSLTYGQLWSSHFSCMTALQVTLLPDAGNVMVACTQGC